MGVEIDREEFTEADFTQFCDRLQDGLQALEETVHRPGFGLGETTIGAELELNVVDEAGSPHPHNLSILAKTDDDRLTAELDRWNVECNTRPVRLAGASFSALERELTTAVDEVRRAAALRRGRVVAIGILPTLRAEHLTPAMMTDRPRYRALSRGLRNLRRAPFQASIDGDDPLTFTCDDVTMVGANTSFQVHLRVRPSEFARTYNAAQLATIATLAASGNAPTFLGHRLWEETRVALFKQGTDHRAEEERGWRSSPRVCFGHGWVREGIVELFGSSVALHAPILPIVTAEDPLAVTRAGGVPELFELKLHHGTTYPWTRGIYDAAGGGHLRIEYRALAAGPTLVDMMANSAFMLGVTLALAPDIHRLLPALPFEHANWSFYRAAQHGLDAELLWPSVRAPSPTQVRAREVVRSLLPLAREALLDAGVDSVEVDRLLGVFEARVESGRTGARYQRRVLDRLAPRMGRERAAVAMLERYMERSATGEPVHTWPDDE
jgi:hypothetical protein